MKDPCEHREPPTLPTVLLRHEAPDGTHYDWLLGDPADPDGPLWTARTRLPSEQWPSVGEWMLEPIAPHRRHYLTHQGDIGGGRGTVARIDQGTHRPEHWSPDRILTTLAMRRVRGTVELVRVDERCWRARMVPPSLDADRLTWAVLLGRWVEFARAAVALPTQGRGGRLRDSVPDLIALQAVWFALHHLSELSHAERSLGLDRARVLIDRHADALARRWDGNLPASIAELLADARAQWTRAATDYLGSDAPQQTNAP